MKYMKYLVFMLMMVLMVSCVSAAIGVTMVTPATSGKVSGYQQFKFAITGMNDANTVNLTLTAASTKAGVSTTTVNSSLAINATLSGNVTINTALLADENDYTFTVTVKNNSAAAQSATASSTSVTIDNTAPGTPSALSPATTTTKTSSNFQITFTSTNMKECYIQSRESPYLTGTSVKKTGTVSSSTCTVTAPTLGWSDGYYYYSAVASDGTNETSLASQAVKVRTKTSTGVSAMMYAQGQAQAKDISLTGGPLGESGMAPLAFIGIAILVYGFYKKK